MFRLSIAICLTGRRGRDSKLVLTGLSIEVRVFCLREVRVVGVRDRVREVANK